MAARLSVPTLTTLACVLLVHVQLTTQVTPPPCNPADNLYTPVFVNSVVEEVISETLAVDTSVAKVTASDNDTVCDYGSLMYSIIGDGSATTYFGIEKETGTVSLKSSLTNTFINSFTVRIQAADGGIPSKTNTTVVRIRVNRSRQANMDEA